MVIRMVFFRVGDFMASGGRSIFGQQHRIFPCRGILSEARRVGFGQQDHVFPCRVFFAKLSGWILVTGIGPFTMDSGATPAYLAAARLRRAPGRTSIVTDGGGRVRAQECATRRMGTEASCSPWLFEIAPWARRCSTEHRSINCRLQPGSPELGLPPSGQRIQPILM